MDFKKILLKITLIVKDAIRLCIDVFIATTLISVCLKNGWINFCPIEFTKNMFWQLYFSFTTIIPIIMFYRGFTGQYNSTSVIYKIQVQNWAKECKNINDFNSKSS